MAFRGLTKKGADYLATRLANELAVEFLKVEIGDGAIISGQNPKNQTSLISYKKDVRILKKEQENNAINLTIQITNDDITQGFYLKEIGIYVNDSTSNGCLYWYCNEDNAQYIPAKTDSVIAFEIDIRMEVTNSDATIINWSGKNTWINKEYLEENYTQNGGYKGTALEIDDRVVSALGKEDGKFPLTEAVKGNVYYFPGNKKFYICKEAQNRRVSVPDGNFEELSIWENRKRLENLISLKNTGNCNAVFSDCLIGVEHWSGASLRNKPSQDISNMGTLITFNLGRKTQIYISNIGVYTRVNQAAQDETTWTAWVKLS